MMPYTPQEANYLKEKRLEENPTLELVQCEDGLFRTKEEKEAWDKALGWSKD